MPRCSDLIDFLTPRSLLLLLTVPLLVGFYLYALRRKKRVVLRYANIGIVKEAAGARSSIRRHIPPAILLAAICVAFIATARPSAMLTLPSERSQVILAMDVSVSMRARDVEPDRFTVAKEAAKSFIKEMPRNTQIGIVAFAGNAMLVHAPTENRDDLVRAVEGFRLQRATNIGDAILTSLETVFPGLNFDAAVGQYDRRSRRRQGLSLDDTPPDQMQAMAAVPPGSHKSAVIILLTDGQATTGPDPIAAARIAADRGVRVFTVGLGSTSGEIVGWGGRSLRVQIDEETLKTVADLTRAKYFFANSGAVLNDVYKDLNTELVMERRPTEITFIFAALSALLCIAAATLSLLWTNRLG